MNAAPLRKIVDRPSQFLETLECGHTIQRQIGLGVDLMQPSRQKRRRCYKCDEEARQRAKLAVAAHLAKSN